MNDVFVQYYDMPTTIRSFAKANSDGSFTIVINSKLSYESRLERYKHELFHITNGDFDHDKEESVQVVEARAHAPEKKPGMTKEEIDLQIEKIRKRKKRLAAAMRRREKKVRELERMGYDFFAAAEARYLDPEWKRRY